MTFRRHLLTGEPILVAPERASRPNAYAREAVVCPFCPGHETETPPEIARIGEPWRVRVFPNKYPFAPHHEVIVESPDHEAEFATIAHARDVVQMYADRYRALRDDAAYVALFKNHGAAAGASLPHVHSQIAALPFVPPRIERERDGFADAKSCPICEGKHDRRFIGERWLAPQRHVSEISDLEPHEIDELAVMLQTTAAQMNGAHNWLFMNFPGAPRAHFYVAVIPRSSPVAGFELMTGTFIDTER